MYEELVKMLRKHHDEHCQLDRASGVCGGVLANEAADAIEELQAQNNELLFRCGQAEALIDYYQTGKLLSNEPPKEET